MVAVSMTPVVMAKAMSTVSAAAAMAAMATAIRLCRQDNRKS
jgi:hypothetical protein